MLAVNLQVYTRLLIGRGFIASRVNYLLPLTTKLCADICAVHREASLRTHVRLRRLELFHTSFRPTTECGVLRRSESKLNTFNLGHNPFVRTLKFTMPTLKGRRSGSVKELILGKKKNKRAAAEAEKEPSVNGEQELEEEASPEPTSQDSTEVDQPDAETTEVTEQANGDANKVEEAPAAGDGNGADEVAAEEEAAPAVEEAAKPEPEADPEPEPEPTPEVPGVGLGTVVKKLENFAPLSLAEDWDNVGLLVEPSEPREVKKILLTIDLTEDVLDEAINSDSNFILSYHPPIFSPLKRLTMKSEKERIIVKAIEKGIAVYSPHTAHDAVKGGVNDWLISAFGEQNSSAISSNAGSDARKFKLEIAVAKPYKQRAQEVFTVDNGGLPKVEKTGDGWRPDRGKKQRTYHFKAICGKNTLTEILNSLNEKNVKRTTQITELFPDPCGEVGLGRFAKLAESLSLQDCITKVKEHLSLEHVQLALGKGKDLESSIESVAVCAGSGGKVLAGTPADLYLTGEMSHHEVLAAVAKGTSVITCNHSNTERGYLGDLKVKLEGWLGGDVTIQVSGVDSDPLKVV